MGVLGINTSLAVGRYERGDNHVKHSYQKTNEYYVVIVTYEIYIVNHYLHKKNREMLLSPFTLMPRLF